MAKRYTQEELEHVVQCNSTVQFASDLAENNLLEDLVEFSVDEDNEDSVLSSLQLAATKAEVLYELARRYSGAISERSFGSDAEIDLDREDYDEIISWLKHWGLLGQLLSIMKEHLED